MKLFQHIDQLFDMAEHLVVLDIVVAFLNVISTKNGDFANIIITLP